MTLSTMRIPTVLIETFGIWYDQIIYNLLLRNQQSIDIVAEDSLTGAQQQC